MRGERLQIAAPPHLSRRARSPARAGAQGAGGRSHLQLWRNESGAAAAAAAERVWHPESPGIENNLGKAVGGVCARALRGEGGGAGGAGCAGRGEVPSDSPAVVRTELTLLSFPLTAASTARKLNPLTAWTIRDAASALLRARQCWGARCVGSFETGHCGPLGSALWLLRLALPPEHSLRHPPRGFSPSLLLPSPDLASVSVMASVSPPVQEGESSAAASLSVW